MDKLPIELLSHIFSYLGIKNIVRARSVSKKWRNVADKQKIKDLVIRDNRNQIDYLSPWFHTGEKIDLANVLKIDFIPKKNDLFEFESYQMNLLSNLKRLMIDTELTTDIHKILYNLHRFPVLEQLDFNMLIETEPKLMICHDNLKVLSFSIIIDGQLEIWCPNLQYLGASYSDLSECVKFRYPNKLKYLNALLFFDWDILKQFKNLETIDDCWNLDFEADFLIELSKLSEIRFEFKEDYGDGQTNALFTFKNSMINLIEMKNDLNRSELKISLDGVELKSIGQFMKLMIDDYEEKFVENYGYQTDDETDIESDNETDSDMEF